MKTQQNFRDSASDSVKDQLQKSTTAVSLFSSVFLPKRHIFFCSYFTLRRLERECFPW